MNTYIQAATDAINGLTKEIQRQKDLIAELEERIENSDNDSDITEELEELQNSLTEIILSGGTLYADLSGLDYLTRESFKTWVREHAITNSEPLFNA